MTSVGNVLSYSQELLNSFLNLPTYSQLVIAAGTLAVTYVFISSIPCCKSLCSKKHTKGHKSSSLPPVHRDDDTLQQQLIVQRNAGQTTSGISEDLFSSDVNVDAVIDGGNDGKGDEVEVEVDTESVVRRQQRNAAFLELQSPKLHHVTADERKRHTRIPFGAERVFPSEKYD